MHKTHGTHTTRETLTLVLAALAAGLFSLAAPAAPSFAAEASDDDTAAAATPAPDADNSDDADDADMEPINTEKIQGFRGPDSVTVQELNDNGPFPAGPENTAYAQYFTGTSYLTPVSGEQVQIASVTFEAGCRNNWHVHTASSGGGQLLIATAGRGYYQIWGQPAVEMRPGDVVHIPANVKHWHGAAPNTAFQHLAIAVPGQNTDTRWEEAVEAEDYDKLQ